MFHRRGNMQVGSVGFVLVVLCYASQVTEAAYQTKQKWQGSPTTDYSIDPDLRLKLSYYRPVVGTDSPATDITTAASKWNWSSRFTFRKATYPSNNIITARDMDVALPCGENSNVIALTCIYSSGDALTSTDYYFNVSRDIEWRTDGVQDHNTYPLREDVLSNALHELGHWLRMGHNGDTRTVMQGDGTARSELHYEDKRGVTQMWEDGQTGGWWHYIAFRQSVAGYFNSDNPGPELSPVGIEMGVVPAQGNGSKMERLAGYAQSGYAYCYFTLFTYETDNSDVYPNLKDRQYVTIRPGMRLTWYQYNYQQRTMSVDLELIDPVSGAQSYLRNSGLKDQNQVPVHPAARGPYGENVWHYFSVDLSPLQGKKIIRYIIAYDNGNNGRTGQFRAYFDNLILSY